MNLLPIYNNLQFVLKNVLKSIGIQQGIDNDQYKNQQPGNSSK